MEENNKYYKPLQFQNKARYEIGSIPKCFDFCMTNVEAGLSPVEKNCMVNCYYKRLGIPEDTHMYFMQKHVNNQRRYMLDETV